MVTVQCDSNGHKVGGEQEWTQLVRADGSLELGNGGSGVIGQRTLPPGRAPHISRGYVFQHGAGPHVLGSASRFQPNDANASRVTCNAVIDDR